MNLGEDCIVPQGPRCPGRNRDHAFEPRANRPDECAQCHRERCREWYEKNRAHKNAKSREWYHANRERARANWRRWRARSEEAS